MEPLFLSFETATRLSSAALLRGSQVVGTWRGDGMASQAEQLLPNIAHLLQSNNCTLRDLAFCGVALGPGSFTGLRVGLATAQGLSDALGLPLVGVETLPALALHAGPSPRTVALLAAGRSEVFAQSFAVDEAGPATPLDELRHLPPARLFEQMQEFNPLLWAGDGATFLHSDALMQHANAHHLQWHIAANDAPLAVSVGCLAWALYRAGVVSHDLTRALYARSTDIKTN